VPNAYSQRQKSRIMFQKHVFNQKRLDKISIFAKFLLSKHSQICRFPFLAILKMIQPLELYEMNLLELYEKLSDNDFERWMTNLDLLHSSMLCDNCQQPMMDTSYVASSSSSPSCAPPCRSHHTLSKDV